MIQKIDVSDVSTPRGIFSLSVYRHRPAPPPNLEDSSDFYRPQNWAKIGDDSHDDEEDEEDEDDEGQQKTDKSEEEFDLDKLIQKI